MGCSPFKLQFKILYNVELQELCKSHSIFWLATTMWLQCAGHVAHGKDQ
jgi:hypothetical protein